MSTDITTRLRALELLSEMKLELERSGRESHGGMGGQLHNSADFANTSPHVRSRIAWWIRELERALEGPRGAKFYRPDEVLDSRTAMCAALEGAELLSSYGRRIRITDRGIEVMEYNSSKWSEAICPFSEGATYSVSTAATEGSRKDP